MVEKLVFDKKYFEGETKYDFYIEPMMKNAWAAQLEILRRIDVICEKNNIEYFADWGTLLGAIRHKGIIPWDDDIDICMKRKDMEKFLGAIDEGNTNLMYLNIYQDENWGAHAIKVVNTTEFSTKRRFIKEFFGFPFTAGIDIFVLDNVPRNKRLEEEQKEVLSTIAQIRVLKEEMKEYSKTSVQYAKGVKILRELLGKVSEMCQIEFSDANPSEQELLILSDEVAALYKDENVAYYTQADCYINWDYKIPIEAYSSSKRVPFENITIPVPVGYDDVLRLKYGEEYMTPQNIAAGHDYPFYGTLISALSKIRNEDENVTDSYVRGVSSDFYRKFVNKSSEPKVNFDETYFGDEEINGVFVNEERKRIWAAEIEVLEEIKRVCKKLDINVFAVGETILDAEEYKDFSPNTEDINLGMLREDYIKFMKNFQEELDPWFDYSSLYSDDEHEDLRCFIITDSYMCDDVEYLKRFHGCPHIVGVAISPIDIVDSSEKQDDLRVKLVSNLIKTSMSMPDNGPYDDKIIEIVEDWKNSVGVDINLERNLRREFAKAADTIVSAYRGDGDYVRVSSELQDGINNIFKKEWFDDTVEVDFNNTTILLPVGYKEMIEG